MTIFNNRNPLQIAILKDRHYIFSTLIIGKAHLIKKLDGHGETALFDACINIQVELVNCCLIII